MAIKLKNNIKKYLSEVWLIEILLVLFICFYFGVEFYKSTSSKSFSAVISSIEATINPQEYYKENIEGDLTGLAALAYKQSGALENLYYGNDKSVKILQDYFVSNSFEGMEITLGQYSSSIPKNSYFIIRNKNSNKIITNDSNANLAFGDSRYTDKYIRDYIKDKFNGREAMINYDNSNTFNLLVRNGFIVSDKSILNNYEEYYYTSIDKYINKDYSRITLFAGILATIGLISFFKILTVLIQNGGRVHIRGNFISSIVYVLKYGFGYKQTKKILIISIVCSIIFFIGYLYLLAIGGYDNNIIGNFFKLYPFKGSILLVTLPMIGVIYSAKKIIEISMVNDSLRKINEGKLDYKIVANSAPEILELIKNITKIKDGYEIAVEEALKNERLKTELISNVSHDLRTPLTSIINYVNILEEEGLTEEERKEYLKIVEQKSKKLKVLIDDLFEMSKINSGKMEISKEKIDIMSLIHQAIGEYSYLYEDKNVEFRVNSFSEEIIIELDGKMISRAIENIVINALKYSLAGTRVYVDITGDNENIEIAFKNISNYDMSFDNEEIFERFARGDRSRNSNIEGSGLGLAITKSIVELHSGEVNICREGDMFKIFIKLPV